MVSRASVVTLTLALCLTSFSRAQINQDSKSASAVIAAVEGKVVAPDGRPTGRCPEFASKWTKPAPPFP
jgi:hypothetical protein